VSAPRGTSLRDAFFPFLARIRRMGWVLALAGSTGVGAAPVASVVVFPVQDEAALRETGAAIWARSDGLIVASADADQVAALAARGLEPGARIADEGQWLYLFHHPAGLVVPQVPGGTVHPLTGTLDLYTFPMGSRVELPRVKPRGGFRAVPRVALDPLAPHPADRVPAAAPTAANPLVQAIVNATDQPTWFQSVKDLSGENPVVVGGVQRTILTRYSDAMFPTPSVKAYATEYLLERAANWGYAGVRESYTSAVSGCSQGTWQNVVFTLPGQLDFGQHQQVIFVTHYDSLSYSPTENMNYAPGADDAISGGMALLEALRLFRGYGFKNTVKIVFFSGEEEGLCGSLAYVNQHPTADMWRAINMDQTAYDGNKNKLMDVYNWSLANSPQSVALGDVFVQANSDYGPIVDPAKVVRDTSHMCQTDHCPFWGVGVAAIALTEDLHNNDICPCFDQLQTATCHDTVTQIDPNHPGNLMFDQNYSWPTEKAAIALVAHLAEPLYACPAAAPSLVATAQNHGVHLDWPVAPGVTNYVVERGSSCAGPFSGLASVAGTSFDDAGVENGATYAYRLRTCPTQVSACVLATPNGPSAVYQAGSAAVVADSIDHDLVPDNCELVEVQLGVHNDGNAALTHVRLQAVQSTHPGVQVASAVPEEIGSLAIGQTKPASFKFYLGRNGNPAACGQALPFFVSTSSDQSPAFERSFALTAERDKVAGPLTYAFETDLSGWSVTAGSFTRVAGGAPGSTAFSLHSENANNVCDAVVSPIVQPAAGSTLSLWINYNIESGPWDRAVVRVIDPATGTKTHLTPVSGAPYTTTGSTSLCDGIGGLSGWSGNLANWTQSSFDLGPFAGTPIQIEVRFATDGASLGTKGFWFDLVQITNAAQLMCDATSNLCAALPAEVSPPASPVPFRLKKTGANDVLVFSESTLATSYRVYAGTLAALRSGLYDHAAAPGLCGLADPVGGDGSVTVTLADSALPSGAYFLAVAANAAGEGVYGTSSTGTIPLALAACP
jgi:hypothetical protein